MHTRYPPQPANAVTDVVPRFPTLEACYFYHAFDELEGIAGAEWDLRERVGPYLGEVNFSGRSVLEVGPASGFLSFHMERAGAAVTCVEPPMSHLWDVVPHKDVDEAAWRETFTKTIEGVRNSFWYMHQKLGSSVRVVEANACDLPVNLGQFDVGVLAAVLLHCRNPFDMLQSVADRIGKTIVITEVHNPALGDAALCNFLPHTGVEQVHTWWHFTPQFFVSALGLMGFTRASVSVHLQKQPAENREVSMFTVVCERLD